VKQGSRQALTHRGAGLARRPRHEQVVARGNDSLGNRRDLRGSLALPEDHFGEALAQAAMVIDPGETQVLEWCLAQKL